MVDLRSRVLAEIDRRGWSRNELIRRSCANESAIKRWLRGDSNPNLQSVAPVLATLGIRCVPGGSAGKLPVLLVRKLAADKRSNPELAKMLHVGRDSVPNLRRGVRGFSVDSAQRAMVVLGIDLA